MVRTALNAVTEDWETFVQSVLGRADLPNWDSTWEILRQDVLCRFTKRQYNTGSRNVKNEEEEDVTFVEILCIWGSISCALAPKFCGGTRVHLIYKTQKWI